MFISRYDDSKEVVVDLKEVIEQSIDELLDNQ